MPRYESKLSGWALSNCGDCSRDESYRRETGFYTFAARETNRLLKLAINKQLGSAIDLGMTSRGRAARSARRLIPPTPLDDPRPIAQRDLVVWPALHRSPNVSSATR